MSGWDVAIAVVGFWLGFKLRRLYVAHGAYARGWMDGYYESEERYVHLRADREHVEAQRENSEWQ